jgi:hypothetical protein
MHAMDPTPGAELSAFERLVVHERCEALGLQHQSTGEDAARAVRCSKLLPATLCAEEAAASENGQHAERQEPMQHRYVASQNNDHRLPHGAHQGTG